MNLRWLVGNFSDPEFKLTRREQSRVTWLAHHKYLSKKRLWIWTAAMVFVSYAIVGFGWDALAGLLRSWGIGYPRIASVVILCIVTCIAAAWMYRYIYIGPVRRAMRELGHDICIGCGYRLQGLDGSVERCPECGTRREPMPMPAKGTDSP